MDLKHKGFNYTYTLIFITWALNNIYCQSNMIPNGDFENGISHPNCSNSNNNYGNNKSLFDNDISNWKNVDNGYPWWLEYNICGYLSKCTDLSQEFNKKNKYVYFDNRITKCRRKSDWLGGGCQKTKLLYSTIGVGLLNNKTFPTGKSLIMRYKIIPVYPDYTEYDPTCCYDEYNTVHLRVFFSELLQHWYKSYSDKVECINCNYVKYMQYFPVCQWQQIERGFTIPSNMNNLTSLILYPESGGMLIDDVEIFEECETPYYIQNKIYNFPVFTPGNIEGHDMRESSGGKISAGNSITSSKAYGDVIIQNGTKVIFTASDEIELKEGFYVEEGGIFEALILPCPNSYGNRLLNNNTNDTFNTEWMPIKDSSIINFYDLYIIPNPTSSHIHISIPEEDWNDLTHIYLLTPLGVKTELPKSEVQDLSPLPNGMYFLQFHFSNGMMVVKSMVKAE